jgi:hypothetical protein
MPARRDTHEHAVGKKNLKFMSNKQLWMKKRLLSTQSEVQYIYKVNSVYLNPRALLCKLEQDRAAWCKRTRAERSQPLPNVLSGLIGARQKCAHSAAFWHLRIATAPQLRMLHVGGIG